MLSKKGFAGWNFACVGSAMPFVVAGASPSRRKAVGRSLIVVVIGKEEPNGLDWKFKDGVGGIVRPLGGGWRPDDLPPVVDSGTHGQFHKNEHWRRQRQQLPTMREG